MDIVVCHICGSGSRPDLIAKCALCNAYEHGYCMPVVTFVIPREWYCAGCQEYAIRCPESGKGGRAEIQKPWHGYDKMKDRENVKMHLSRSNLVQQINPESSTKFGNSKVKFISSDEVVSLNRERPPYVRSRFSVGPSKAHPSSPPSTKHSSNLKCISPSRSVTQVQALKRCATASHDQKKIEDRPYSTQQRQVHPTSPQSVKQPSNTKSISPIRSGIQVQALKQCASSSRVQAKIDDINMKKDTRSGGSMPIIRRCRTSKLAKVKPDSLFEDKAKETKIANADEGEINSKLEDEPMEKGTLCASDRDTGRKSETESLNHNRDVLISIDSSMEYTRRPPSSVCWMGCFHVFDAGVNHNLGGFKAQFPSKVKLKVYDIIKRIPSNLQLELLPRMNDWPKPYETSNPVYEDIGLFFFPNEPDGHEKKHSYLLEASSNYVLRAYIDGVKLLIYSSDVLPHDSQWIDGKSYLWGIFVKLKGKNDPQQFGSTTT